LFAIAPEDEVRDALRIAAEKMGKKR
jgi:hypothetical protein